MKLTEFLSEDCVLPLLKAQDKRAALAELASPLAGKLPGHSPEKLLQVLLEREKLGSTGIGESVAIPHGKLPGIDSLVAVFGRAPAGLAFEALDGRPAKLFIALFAPESSPGVHLKALARIGRLFKNPAFREALLAAPADAAILHKLLVDEDAKA